MNGAQDLGGMMGFGPVTPERHEPPFHAPWERRVFALALAMGFTGAWTLDASRAARERLPPADYLAWSYYAIWLAALEQQVVEQGLARPEELVTGTITRPPSPVARVLTEAMVEPRFAAGFPSDRPAAAPARFAIGDEVVARNIHPAGHTRLPRYVRGRRGRVERRHGAFVFPDASADPTAEGAPPQWLYSVGFDALELWGPSSGTGGRVVIAAFESYLSARDDA